MNISNIAEIANVSVATVSRVLNNPDTVKKSTREKVLKIIEESDYIPNAMARSLSTNIHLNIGVAFPDIQNQFFSSMFRGITQKAASYGYNVYFYDTDEDVEKERTFLMTVREQRFMGIIMSPVSEENDVSVKMISNLEKSGIPVIIVDRDLRNIDLDGVFFQDVAGSHDAVKCLVDEGHKNIATIAGPQAMKPGRERLEGYIQAIKNAGITINEDYIVNGRFQSDGGYEAAKRLMKMPVPPSAIFTANNLMTLGCLKYFRENHIEIGKDIAIVGYDEIEVLAYAGYNLTTIERPTVKMGEEAVNLMNWRITSGSTSGKVHNRTTIATNLIKRGSEKLTGGGADNG